MANRSLDDDLPGKPLVDAAAAGENPPLAHRADFCIGGTNVRPSIRSLEGPDNIVKIEPRVMQLLLALVDANGGVRTREQLERLCWKGQIVGEDALTRAMFELRRAIRAVRAGFQVETIPRIGYRLLEAAGAETPAFGDNALPEVSPELPAAPTAPPPSPAPRHSRISRRGLVAAGVVGAAMAGGAAIGFTLMRESSPDAEVAALLNRGRQALRDELPDDQEQGAEYLEKAAGLDPGRSETWGLLALSYRNMAEHAEPADISSEVRKSEAAAQRALSLNPKDGNALTALATMKPYFGDWQAAEDRLRAVLAVAPRNEAAMNHLVALLQSVGLDRQSWDWNERAISIDPMSPIPLFRRAYKHWIFGDLAKADQVIDRTLQLWPRHPSVWQARLTIFAFSGRPRAAMAMIEDKASRPLAFGERALAQWHPSLVALDSGTPGDIARARRQNLAMAPRSPGYAFNALLILSALGELDAAFAIAEGLLLRRGPYVVTLWTGNGQMPVNDLRWRRTQPLFIPASAPMRADPRFARLCQEIGLTDYWRVRNVTSDFARATGVAVRALR